MKSKLTSITEVGVPLQVNRVEIVGGCSRSCIFKDEIEDFITKNAGFFSV